MRSAKEVGEVRERAFELYPPRTRAGLDPALPGEFATRIARLRKAHRELSGRRDKGSLGIIDLTPVKERAGTRWDLVRPIVWANVEASLARRLEGPELYVAADEVTVWILALARERAEVDRRVALIAADITERLLGVAPGGAGPVARSLPFDYEAELATLAGMVGLRERVRRAQQALAEAEAALLREHAAELVALYRPVLALRVPLIVGYRAFARLATAGGALVVPATLCPDPATGAFDAELDHWLLGQAMAHLAPGRPKAELPVLAVPVHRATLATPGFRGPWQNLLAELPAVMINRLILELVDRTPRRPPGDLRGMLASLEGRVAFVIVRVPPDPSAIAPLAGSGARAASIDASTLDPTDPGTVARLAELAAACRAAGVRSLLVPVANAALAGQARAAGIDYIAGDACLPPLRTPGPPVDLRQAAPAT